MSATLRITTAVVALGAAGCASGRVPVATTPLEARQFQVHTFEAADATLVLKAAVNTLMDDGFIIDTSDAQLGLLTATHKRSTRSFLGTMTSVMTYGRVGPWRTTVIEANVKIDAFGGGSRARVSFRLTHGGTKDSDSEATPIFDPAVYQAFYARLDKSVFLLKEKL